MGGITDGCWAEENVPEMRLQRKSIKIKPMGEMI